MKAIWAILLLLCTFALYSIQVYDTFETAFVEVRLVNGQCEQGYVKVQIQPPLESVGEIKGNVRRGDNLLHNMYFADRDVYQVALHYTVFPILQPVITVLPDDLYEYRKDEIKTITFLRWSKDQDDDYFEDINFNVISPREYEILRSDSLIVVTIDNSMYYDLLICNEPTANRKLLALLLAPGTITARHSDECDLKDNPLARCFPYFDILDCYASAETSRDSLVYAVRAIQATYRSIREDVLLGGMKDCRLKENLQTAFSEYDRLCRDMLKLTSMFPDDTIQQPEARAQLDETTVSPYTWSMLFHDGYPQEPLRIAYARLLQTGFKPFLDFSTYQPYSYEDIGLILNEAGIVRTYIGTD